MSTVGCIWELIRQLREESQLSDIATSLDRIGQVFGSAIPDEDFQYQSIR